MTEPMPFESSVTTSYERTSRTLTLADVSSTTKTIVRADPDSPAAGQLDAPFGTSRRHGSVLVCGQRPGEWMLLGAKVTNGELVASLDQSGHVSVIDHTHSRALFRLTGEHATAVLEKICNLDWSDSMTPDRAVVSTSVAKVNCDVARDDDGSMPSFLIACDRSFGQYLFDAILDAGHEFDIGVG